MVTSMAAVLSCFILLLQQIYISHDTSGTQYQLVMQQIIFFFFILNMQLVKIIRRLLLVGRAKINLQCPISMLVQAVTFQVLLSGYFNFIALSFSEEVRVVCQMREYFLKNLKRSNRHLSFFLVIGGTIYSNLSFVFQRFLNMLHANKVVGTQFFSWALFPISCLT